MIVINKNNNNNDNNNNSIQLYIIYMWVCTFIAILV